MGTRDKKQSGFTLPELLAACVLVVGLLALALALAHPEDFSVRKRNAERWLAVAQHMQAINSYAVKEGALPVPVTEEKMAVGSESGMANICPLIVPDYADKLIYDPLFGRDGSEGGCGQEGSLYTTGMAVIRTKDDKVTVSAPGAEAGEEISLTRQF